MDTEAHVSGEDGPSPDLKKIKYQIAITAIGRPAALDITKERYDEIKTARDGLGEIISAEGKFDTLLENHAELEESLLRFALRDMVFEDSDFVSMQRIRNELNRRILNFLSASRLYLDALVPHVRAVCGESGNHAETIKAKTSDIYDRSIGYRVMEALRNYSQHRELPVQNLELRRSWHGDNNERKKTLVYSVAPQLNVAQLSTDKKFKVSVLAEIAKIGPAPELMPLQREYVEGLCEIHEHLRTTIRPQEDIWDKTIRSAIIDFAAKHLGEGIVLLAAVEVREDGSRWNPIYIGKEALEYRKYLKDKNRGFVNFSKRHVRGGE